MSWLTAGYGLWQEVLGRLLDSVVGSYKADFLEKTEGNADLCADTHCVSCTSLPLQY